MAVYGLADCLFRFHSRVDKVESEQAEAHSLEPLNTPVRILLSPQFEKMLPFHTLPRTPMTGGPYGTNRFQVERDEIRSDDGADR